VRRLVKGLLILETAHQCSSYILYCKVFTYLDDDECIHCTRGLINLDALTLTRIWGTFDQQCSIGAGVHILTRT
jgi:hypothetical protein